MPQILLPHFHIEKVNVIIFFVQDSTPFLIEETTKLLSIVVFFLKKKINKRSRRNSRERKYICSYLSPQRACLLHYNGRNRTAGTYAVALTLEDFPERTTDFSSVTRFSAVGLQFLVIITTRSGSCTDVPLFTKSTPSDGECTEVQIGSAYRAVIEVKLQDLSRQ